MSGLCEPMILAFVHSGGAVRVLATLFALKIGGNERKREINENGECQIENRTRENRESY